MSKPSNNSSLFEYSLLLVAQGLLATFFLLAGVFKLDGRIGPTVAAISAINVLPNWLPLAIAKILPYFEIALAVLLVCGKAPRIVTWVTIGTLTAFSAWLVLLGVKIGWVAKCGCMGPFNKATILVGLGRNAALLVVAFALLILNRRLRRISLTSSIATVANS